MIIKLLYNIIRRRLRYGSVSLGIWQIDNMRENVSNLALTELATVAKKH